MFINSFGYRNNIITEQVTLQFYFVFFLFTNFIRFVNYNYTMMAPALISISFQYHKMFGFFLLSMLQRLNDDIQIAINWLVIFSLISVYQHNKCRTLKSIICCPHQYDFELFLHNQILIFELDFRYVTFFYELLWVFLWKYVNLSEWDNWITFFKMISMYAAVTFSLLYLKRISISFERSKFNCYVYFIFELNIDWRKYCF